ncbi:MAG TPA: hypothetical protein DD657_06020 [Culturomica sp.]|nr:hypothetical protein [Culturomica sp.]
MIWPMRLFCAFLIFFGTLCSVYADGYVKYVRKLLPVAEGTDFYMESIYGHITLHQWEKDSVLVEASFQVERAEDWEKEELAGQLDLLVETWPGTINIRTQVAEEFEQAGSLLVETVLWVPKGMVMDLVGRYSFIYVPAFVVCEHTSLTAIYGDIRIDSLQSVNDREIYLNVSYGKLLVDCCSKALIRSSYSSVDIDKASFLQIKAEKSQIEVQAADTLISEGKYNVYRVKKKGIDDF